MSKKEEMILTKKDDMPRLNRLSIPEILAAHPDLKKYKELFQTWRMNPDLLSDDDWKIIEKNQLVDMLKFIVEEDVKKEFEGITEEQGSTKEDYDIMTRRGQIEYFWEKQPFYYDSNKIFWLWDKKEFKWIMSDEVDFCNAIYKELNIDSINSKVKAEVIEGFKQIGRAHKPMEMDKYWVQFKSKIYDIKTGENFEATHEYFVTNPIPWDVGESEDTPTIDKYFDDWIQGQDPSWKDTLYEIIAYNITINKFMQRIITLCGGGSNGKGSYIKLNYRFLGEDNYVASELKALSEDKFEPAVLHKKLLCVMGEVYYDDLKNTNQLKKLGGEDKISFQFKGKTPFTEDNTATCICLTNSMPITPDKTKGFYRKWLIVDFLNQFKEINKSLIDNIPDEEFKNLAKKSLRILKELYKTQKFTNEGDFDEREKRYEERSNPIIKFIELFFDEESGKIFILRDFVNLFNEYLKNNHLRILTSKQIGKILREEGFVIGKRKIGDDSAVVILNLALKLNIEEIKINLNDKEEACNP